MGRVMRDDMMDFGRHLLAQPGQKIVDVQRLWRIVEHDVAHQWPAQGPELVLGQVGGDSVDRAARLAAAEARVAKALIDEIFRRHRATGKERGGNCEPEDDAAHSTEISERWDRGKRPGLASAA